MKKKTVVSKPVHYTSHPKPIKPKPKLPKIAQEELIKPDFGRAAESMPKPSPPPKADPPKLKAKGYTMEDWQAEVAKYVKPGRPIPDWLSAKAPS